MRSTENYGLNLAEGSDKYNHLTIDNPNYEKIDSQMKVNESYSVPIATELKADTVHALTRLTPSAALFRFTATSNYQSGETFTVDNEQVTALLPSGETLGNLAYTIGAEVLCCLVGTRLTVYVPSGVVAKASDSERLNGEEANYYGTAEGVENAQKTADAAGVLATQNQEDINTLKDLLIKTISVQAWANAFNYRYDGSVFSVYLYAPYVNNIVSISKTTLSFASSNGEGVMQLGSVNKSDDFIAIYAKLTSGSVPSYGTLTFTTSFTINVK